MGFEVLVFCSALLTATTAAPQYTYEPPSVPSGLYDLPADPSEVDPSASDPVEVALPDDPGLDAAAQDPRPVVIRPEMEGMPYDFEWGVQDQESGNAFSHVESSDGQTTQGEYRVLLPDGRTQVVTFFDNGDGYNAIVTYEE
nr:cuticle protein 8-like [Penaeus vannamei]